MLLDVCLGTRTVWKILFVIMDAPGKGVTRKQMQEMTKIGNKLDKYLTILEKFDIIKKQKIGKHFCYNFNMTNPYSEQLLQLYIQEKKDCNAVNFEIIHILREFVYGLIQFNFKLIQSIILFGSYAKRTYHINSDIDIAIITTEKISRAEELLHTDLIDILQKKYNKLIQIKYYTIEEFEYLKKTGNKLVGEILADGLKIM